MNRFFCALVLASSTGTFAQTGVPRPAAGWTPAPAAPGAPAAAARQLQPAETAQQRLAKGEVYVSQRWNASFHLEETLSLPQFPGLTFAGARIVQMQPGSPLTQIGLRPGDVITRLDNTKIDTGKWPNQDGCYWMLPQFERHFGMTTVRYIRSGTTDVVDQSLDLGARCRPKRFPDLPGNVMFP